MKNGRFRHFLAPAQPSEAGLFLNNTLPALEQFAADGQIHGCSDAAAATIIIAPALTGNLGDPIALARLLLRLLDRPPSPAKNVKLASLQPSLHAHGAEDGGGALRRVVDGGWASA